MRVLQINSVCGVGSTGRIASEIGNLLEIEGYESYIAYGRGTARNCDNAIRIGSQLDNYKHVAKTRLIDRHGFGSKKATIDFIKYIQKLNPDIIHLHNLHGYYINIEILFKYLKEVNKPVIWTLHDCWAFTGHCVHFEYVDCDKWKTSCEKCPQIKEYPTSIFDNSNLNFINKKQLFTHIEKMQIVTPSEWLSTLVKQSFLGDYPIKVINNGVDINVFKPTESNFRKKYEIEDKYVVLGVARWDKRKGIEYLIELSKQLGGDYKVVIVGLTQKQKESLPENIIGITQTNEVKELVEIYSTSDVFVNPTLEDNFPTTNLEAMACGTPVIAFDTGGIKEQINLGCGYIVPQGDLDALIKIIVRISNETKEKYTQNCVSLVKENYNNLDRFKQYIDLYKGLITK
jgi:putative colanic acid biosynthesis glycosyltransferase